MGGFLFVSISVLSIAGRAMLPTNGSSPLRLVREVLLFLPAALFYFLLRGLMDARYDEAAANAERVIDVQRWLGLFHEEALQQLALGSSLAIDMMNWIYIWGHWPVIAGVFVWLVLRQRSAYPVYRNTSLLSGVIGMLVFAAFPVVPPRLMDGYAFVDTVTVHSKSYRTLQPPSLTNPYAAMPSLHLGWDLLMGIALVREASSLLVRAVGVLMPVAMFLAIVLTANHYILDGIAGGLLVLVSLKLASTLNVVDWPRYLLLLGQSPATRWLWSPVASHWLRKKRKESMP